MKLLFLDQFSEAWAARSNVCWICCRRPIQR